jgi:hypothetical protein
MRGQQERSGSLLSYQLIEERIPVSYSLWRIRKLADQALDNLLFRWFVGLSPDDPLAPHHVQKEQGATPQ